MLNLLYVNIDLLYDTANHITTFREVQYKEWIH
jgi:hypothetical protein